MEEAEKEASLYRFRFAREAESGRPRGREKERCRNEDVDSSDERQLQLQKYALERVAMDMMLSSLYKLLMDGWMNEWIDRSIDFSESKNRF